MRAPESHRRDNLLLSRIAQALLGFTMLAFAVKALVHTEVQARYTPLVVFHGAVMLGWLTLLATQAWLAARHRLNLHRAMGRASIALVGAMLVSGAIIAVNIGRELGRPGDGGEHCCLCHLRPALSRLTAFARRRDMHAHRQAMLIGTLALMTPAYARLVQVAGLPDPVAIAAQVPITLAVALGYEWVTQGRVTKPVITMLGFSLVVIAVMVAVLLAFFV